MNRFQKLIARFLIPSGLYCYDIVQGKRVYCPFYSIDKTRPVQENGYCSYIGKGDWDINEEYPKDIEINKKQSDGTYKKEMVKRVRDTIFWGMGLLWDACKECGVKYNIGKDK
jgi:hypothetical protein